MTPWPPRVVLFPLLAAALLAWPMPGQAAKSKASCRLRIVTVKFGQYNPFNTADTMATGAVTYRCSQSVPITISLSAGKSRSFAARKMVFGSSALLYNLYQDAAGSIVWGDGSGGSALVTIAAPPAKTSVSLPVYGILARLQTTAKVGSYSDRITATIRF